MADPLSPPLKMSKTFQAYVERHNLYDIFQELLKEMIILKPEDPLVYVRDQIARVAQDVYNPRAFFVGPKMAEVIGRRLAEGIGAKFLTLSDILYEIDDPDIQAALEIYADGVDKGDENSRQLLAWIIQKRVAQPDCLQKGYIIHGYPQSKAQAICAQKQGLLPRQVIIFLPDMSMDDDAEGEFEGEQDTSYREMSFAGESACRSTTEEEEEEEEEGWSNAKDRCRSKCRRPSKLNGGFEIGKGDSNHSGPNHSYSRGCMSTGSRALLKTMPPDVYMLLLKDIATAYHRDICKVIPFEKIRRTSNPDMEAEILNQLIPCIGRLSKDDKDDE